MPLLGEGFLFYKKMVAMQNTYETIFICPGDLSQEKVENTLEKVKSLIQRSEGSVKTSELWGRRKLAYNIQRYRDGFYVYLMFTANEKAPQVLENHYRVTDSVLRGMTVKVDPRYVDKVRNIVQMTQESATVTTSAPAAEAKTVTPAEASSTTVEG